MPFLYYANAVTEGLILCVCDIPVCMYTCSFLYAAPRSISYGHSLPLYIEAKSLAESKACSSSQLTPEIPLPLAPFWDNSGANTPNQLVWGF